METQGVNNNQKNTFGNGLAQVCSVKLDRSNYLLWQSIILPVIQGNKLDGFIFGTKPCPTQFLSEDAEKRINPAYEEWISSDQLLLG